MASTVPMSAQAALCSLARDSNLPASTARELLNFLRTHQALKDALGDAAPELLPCSKVQELWRALLLNSREREAVERAFPGLTQVPHSTQRSQPARGWPESQALLLQGRALAMTAMHCLLGAEPQVELWQEEGHRIRKQSISMFRDRELSSSTAFRPAALLLQSLEGAGVSVESTATVYALPASRLPPVRLHQPQAQLQQQVQQQVQPNNASAATRAAACTPIAVRYRQGRAAAHQQGDADAVVATHAAEGRKRRRGAETATAASGSWQQQQQQQQQQQLAVAKQEGEREQQQGHDQEHGAQCVPSKHAIKREPRLAQYLLVRDTKGNEITFKVPRDDGRFCINKITTAMCKRFGHNSSSSRMMLGSRQLQPDDRLVALQLRDGDTLLLDVRPEPDWPWSPNAAEPCIDVFVKTLNGETKTVRISRQDTVLSLKQRVSEIEGIPANEQRLIWAGMQLEDGEALAHYGIQHESTVHLVLRLRGC